MTIEPTLAITFLGIVGSGGVAYGVVKTVLNGTKQNVVDIKTQLKEHVDEDHKIQLESVQRLARIETSVERLEHIETKLNKALGIAD